MRNIIKNKYIYIILTFFAICIISNKSFASQTTIDISPSSPKIGDTVTIKVNVSGVTNCDVHVNVSGVVSGNIPVVGTSNDGSHTTFSNSKSFRVSSAGSIKAETTAGSNAIRNGNYAQVSASRSVTVSEKTNENNSNNSSNNGSISNNGSTNNSGKTVKMITTSPTDFSGFKASNKGPYKVTVENNISQLNVTVKYSDGSKKSYTKNLQEGSNKISVDGYTIIATRKTAEGEVIPNEIDDEETTDKEDEQKQKLRLDNLVLDDNLNAKLDPNFDSEVFEYTVILGNDYLDLKELYINALPNIDGAKVTIEGNKELTDGETIVTIKVEAEGYETVIYTIKVVKQEIVETEAKPVLEETDDVLDNSKELMKKRIIISSLVCLITFIGIIFIAKECYESTNNLKEKKNNKNRYNEDNDEEYINSKYEEPKEENNILEDLYKIKNSEKELSIEKNGNNTEGNSNNNIQKEEQKEIENNNEKIENTEEKMDEFFSRNTRIEFSEGRTRRKHGKGKHS